LTLWDGRKFGYIIYIYSLHSVSFLSCFLFPTACWCFPSLLFYHSFSFFGDWKMKIVSFPPLSIISPSFSFSFAFVFSSNHMCAYACVVGAHTHTHTHIESRMNTHTRYDVFNLTCRIIFNKDLHLLQIVAVYTSSFIFCHHHCYYDYDKQQEREQQQQFYWLIEHPTFCSYSTMWKKIKEILCKHTGEFYFLLFTVVSRVDIHSCFFMMMHIYASGIASLYIACMCCI
jgi:hypothetical protein